MSELLKAQCAACGFDAEDAAVVAWWEGLAEDVRKELIRMSGASKRKVLTIGEKAASVTKQRQEWDGEPQKSVRTREMIRPSDAR
jgi:hypothetical protein